MSEKSSSSHEQHGRSPEEVLYDALDIAAPDDTAWKQGYAAYYRQLEDGGDRMKAYWDALDASAPDAHLWKAAWALISHETTSEQSNNPEIGLQLSTGRFEAVASYHPNSEDCVLADAREGAFGVFDGMGGEGGNPAAAARAARRAVHSVLHAVPSSQDELIGIMKRSFAKARREVELNGEGGSTVATAVKLCTIDGQRLMGVAHAGDTRLFRYVKQDNTFEALTEDQSRGNLVFNGLTRGRSESGDQYLVQPVAPGDRIMICSDGITGDWADQFLTDEEFLEAFGQTTAQECAMKFYEFSKDKKDDDKSVVVIDIE